MNPFGFEISHPQKPWTLGSHGCNLCNRPIMQTLSAEQKMLNLTTYHNYGKILFRCEEALKNNTLKDTIRQVLAEVKYDRGDLECLAYLVDRLYPEYNEMIGKLMILK